MRQFHVTQERAKATVSYDGAIDGEPRVRMTGPGSFVQDRKVYTEATPEIPGNPGDPDNGIPATDPVPAVPAKTTVAIHHSSGAADDPSALGAVSVSVEADSDLPGTDEQEVLNTGYEFEWIAIGQAKATHAETSLESEPA